MNFEMNQTDFPKKGQLSERLLTAISQYIDDNFWESVAKKEVYESEKCYSYGAEEASSAAVVKPSSVAAKPSRQLDTLMFELQETFSEQLIRLIDVKGKTDVEIYKRANIDRKLFSKIRNDKQYQPSKWTVIAFAIALELNLDETKDLLQKAGFALSPSQKSDLIIEFFITQNRYDFYEINEALFAFNQPLIGV